jgi:hypothetical protein
MGAVESLCSQAIRLHEGRVSGIGCVHDQIAQYLRQCPSKNSIGPADAIRIGESLALRRFRLTPNSIASRGSTSFEIEFVAPTSVFMQHLALLIYSAHGARVAVLDLRTKGIDKFCVTSDGLNVFGRINSLPLTEGDYDIGLFVSSGAVWENLFGLSTLHVSPVTNTNDHVQYPAAHRGVLELDAVVQHKTCNSPDQVLVG